MFQNKSDAASFRRSLAPAPALHLCRIRPVVRIDLRREGRVSLHHRRAMVVLVHLRLSASTTAQSAICFTSWLTVAILAHSRLSDEPALPFRLLLPSLWFPLLARSLLAFIYIRLHTYTRTRTQTLYIHPYTHRSHAHTRICTGLPTYTHTSAHSLTHTHGHV